MCFDCLLFLGDVKKFVARAKVMNSMFSVISSLEESESSLGNFSTYLNIIRAQYKLDPVTEVKTEKVLEIKVENDSENKFINENDPFEKTPEEFSEIEIKEECFDEPENSQENLETEIQNQVEQNLEYQSANDMLQVKIEENSLDLVEMFESTVNRVEDSEEDDDVEFIDEDEIFDALKNPQEAQNDKTVYNAKNIFK